MRNGFLQVSGENFTVDGKKILLRGFAFGNWMNLEHFMIGMPGPDRMIKKAFREVYGADNAAVFFENYLDKYISEKDFILLKSMGVNSVRLPVNYQYFMEDQNPDVFLEKGFRFLDKIIGFCERYQMYAIIDLHAVPGGQNPDWHADNATGQEQFWSFACFRQQMIRLWRYIADYYKDNQWVAGYDILNEPSYGLTKELFNDFYDRTIEAIREVDPDHVIFLEGDDFGRSFELFHEPQDEQIAYAVHYYPFVIDADVLDPKLDEKRRRNIFEQVFYRQLRARERFHRPLWCGETGLEYRRDQMQLYSTMIGYILELCEDNNISWSLWTYKDAQTMGIAFPADNTMWMKFINHIALEWSHHGEMAKSAEILNMIADKYFRRLDPSLWYTLEFRVRSILHVIAVEQVLKENLKSVPWEEMRKMPDSFSFENCGFHMEIINFIREFIASRNK